VQNVFVLWRFPAHATIHSANGAQRL
jgi:hypothetical protein